MTNYTNLLPDEVLIHLFSNLNYVDILKLSLVNVRFSRLANDQALWLLKLKQYFPYLRPVNSADFSYKQQFIREYETYYQHLSKEQIKILECARFGELGELKNSITLPMLLTLRSSRGDDLITWASKHNDQKLLDFYYSLALRYFDESPFYTYPPTGETLFDLTVRCRQKFLLVRAGMYLKNDLSLGDNYPLHVAASYGHLDIVQGFLAEDSIDCNQLDSHQRTPLHRAAENGHLEVVKILIAKGANCNQPDKGGATAISLAYSNGHEQLVDYLIEQGGKLTVESPDFETIAKITETQECELSDSTCDSKPSGNNDSSLKIEINNLLKQLNLRNAKSTGKIKKELTTIINYIATAKDRRWADTDELYQIAYQTNELMSKKESGELTSEDLTSYRDLALTVHGRPSVLSKSLGIAMIGLGIGLAALCALTITGTLGAGVWAGVVLGISSASLIICGAGFFNEGRQKGLSQIMTNLADNSLAENRSCI